mmetsp:Transcript_1986/g.4219  ORF Transcript_1986/g.4219 Transcript_1986/m.4219 type:complete len:213 (+) Transcript_1986:483-1121(+)
MLCFAAGIGSLDVTSGARKTACQACLDSILSSPASRRAAWHARSTASASGLGLARSSRLAPPNCASPTQHCVFTPRAVAGAPLKVRILEPRPGHICRCPRAQSTRAHSPSQYHTSSHSEHARKAATKVLSPTCAASAALCPGRKPHMPHATWLRRDRGTNRVASLAKARHSLEPGPRPRWLPRYAALALTAAVLDRSLDREYASSTRPLRWV